MKLSAYAKKVGDTYKTAYRWFSGRHGDYHHYRRSSSENKTNLDTQAERLVKEVGSGVNDGRKKFLALLADDEITHFVVEHKDRATRFGFRYIETLLEQQGRAIEVVNLAEDEREGL